MLTLKPQENNGFYTQENSDGKLVDEEENFEADNPVYIEESNPEEQYHKFLLTQQSTFEAELQRQTEEEIEELENVEQNDKEAGKIFQNTVQDLDQEALVDDDTNAVAQVDNSCSESSEIFRIQETNGQSEEACENNGTERGEMARLGSQLDESQKFELEVDKGLQNKMDQLENSIEFNEYLDENEKQQNKHYSDIIRASSTEPHTQIKRSLSAVSQTRRLADSVDFKKKSSGTLRASSNFNFALHSTNDFKYIGEQFKVGKINPNLQSTSEKLFQKMYSHKLSYLYNRLNQSNIAMSPRVSNDDKWRGMQFRMGKFQSPVVAQPAIPFEQKFQALFKDRLDVLKPKSFRTYPSYMDLKQTHDILLPVRK